MSNSDSLTSVDSEVSHMMTGSNILTFHVRRAARVARFHIAPC